MKTLKQILEKNTDNLSGYGLLTPEIAIECLKEWLQQKRVEYLLKNPRMWAHRTIDEFLEEIERGVE